ncbi:alpha-1,2-mannosidase, putative [Mucilaginibacter mallensis]|uniref:Alpha-1,2-mannosidase, putative n=1 Tax=Mucilaginibacter mallensis TaxID=652787 RepID=A0A1H1SGS2_MUCMA|nr:GH92 family glycosyl hydrolase [Mucilaginibacter mallensis]SDS47270.1 alpha-1,2-mannosidase, putative [Mucilaginibacter mallensis]
MKSLYKKRIRLSLIFIVIFLTGIIPVVKAQSSKSHHLTSYVDPYIGAGGHGHVFIGASVPFGAVQLGPENFYKGWDWCSGYHYGDSVLIGFAHTHLSGTGIGDLADILIMPYTGTVKTDKGQETVPGSGYASHYSHKNEQVRPGYYAVKLDASGIKVELTATERVGFHQYHFPAGKEAHVIIDLKEGVNDKSTATFIKQVDQYTIEGYRFSKGWAKNQWLFFAIRSSEPLPDFKVYDDNKLLQGNSGSGLAIKGLISFNAAPSILKLKVGISPVSSANALANIDAEIPGWDFQKVAKAADAKWNKELAKISIETKDNTNRRIFYTSLFHAMIDPALFNDHNGDYRGTDKKVYHHAAFDNYTVFSLWDTYRAENPLFDILQPKRAGDMINTMLAIYQQQGKLPIWHLMGNETGTMVGISSMQVVAEAYLKGIKGFDAGKAYEAEKGTAMSDSLGMLYVKNFKPIPTDKQSRSVAKGLEYAVSDGSIALMAKRMGKTADYNYFMKRSKNYQLYFDQADQFFKGKLSDGSWTPGFSPLKSKNDLYAEGNAWQYLWLVPQDVPGLISLLGGDESFNKKLDEFFQIKSTEEDGLADLTGLIGQYAHGNEPSHHVAYLYTYSGQQWKTAEKVRYIMKEFYLANTDGIIGNEDCGQMSAWYIFSSLGFYPVFPASETYVIGSPLFDKASINLDNGKKFTVEAINNSPANIYIQSLLLNGKRYDKSYILHRDIMNGGLLKIVMGSKPNYNFGKLQANRPQ